MMVSTETLLELPIGTLFTDGTPGVSGPIHEISGYLGTYLLVRPMFHPNDMSEKSIDPRIREEWYVLDRDDKNKIARKMGFEAAGIRIIGLK